MKMENSTTRYPYLSCNDQHMSCSKNVSMQKHMVEKRVCYLNMLKLNTFH